MKCLHLESGYFKDIQNTFVDLEMLSEISLSLKQLLSKTKDEDEDEDGCSSLKIIGAINYMESSVFFKMEPRKLAVERSFIILIR